jgi:crotonobetainyl-CoA:carnitine CoA-transferase CaiB-like acyl-CoA transferase
VQALEGVRVLDLGTFIAGPFCATVLGEFGADVIKVERPDGGDHLRQFGTETACGDTFVWLSEGRNKRSVTLNLATPEGRDLLRQLITTADVVVENFRPGVLESWGVGPDEIAAINPRTVLVRISAYGQTGPNRDLPGFARIAHGFSGLAFLSGEPDRAPVTPGSTSLADYVTGLYGALGALLALRAREQTGRGQVVDLALYEPMFRMLDELAPAFQQLGFVRQRMGADTVNVVPHGHFRCRDGHYVAIACSHDGMFARLADAMDQADLAEPGRYGRKEARLRDRDAVNQVVSAWTESLPREEVLSRCRAAGAAAGPIYSIADIFDDPQYAHRGTLVTEDSRIGPLVVPTTLPALSETPGELRWLGPALGADTETVLSELLALSPDQLAALRGKGVI